ncbi:MAG: hypothetical protein HFE78_08375 [Clostridiales bacterium]|nr:hypothetical protein [Clostridiales bacterium]
MRGQDSEGLLWIQAELQGVIDELAAVAAALMAEDGQASGTPYTAALRTAAERYKEILAGIKAAEERQG